MQLDRAIAAAPETEALPKFQLTIVPHPLIFGRVMSAQELTAPLNIMRDPDNPVVFVYDYNDYIGRDYSFSEAPCTIIFKVYPCPDEVVELEYRLNEGYTWMDLIDYSTMISYTLMPIHQVPRLGTLSSPSGWEVDTTTPAPVPQTRVGQMTARLLGISPPE